MAEGARNTTTETTIIKSLLKIGEAEETEAEEATMELNKSTWSRAEEASKTKTNEQDRLFAI